MSFLMTEEQKMATEGLRKFLNKEIKPQLQGNRILLPKNKLCSEFIGPASHFEFASHAGFLGV